MRDPPRDLSHLIFLSPFFFSVRLIWFLYTSYSIYIQLTNLNMGDYGPSVSTRSITAGIPPQRTADEHEISVLITGFGVSSLSSTPLPWILTDQKPALQNKQRQCFLSNRLVSPLIFHLPLTQGRLGIPPHLTACVPHRHPSLVQHRERTPPTDSR
jgi:hypothetical protein